MPTNISLPNIKQDIRVDTKSLTAASNRALMFTKRLRGMREEVEQSDTSLKELAKNSRRLTYLAKSMDKLQKSSKAMASSLKESDKAQKQQARTMAASQRTVKKMSRTMDIHADATERAKDETEQLTQAIKRTPKRMVIDFYTKGVAKANAEIAAASKDRKTKIAVEVDNKQLEKVLGTLSGLGNKGGLGFWQPLVMPAGILSGIAAAIPLLGSMSTQLITMSQAALVAGPAMATLGAAFGVAIFGFKNLGESTARNVVLMRENLKRVGKDWSELQVVVQNAMFKGIGPAIERLSDRALPRLQGEIFAVSKSWNAVFKEQLKFLSGNKALSQMETILHAASAVTREMGHHLKSVLSIILDVGSSGSGVFLDLMKSMTGGLASFAATVEKAKGSGSLEQMMQNGIDMVGRLLKVVGTLGSALGGIMQIGKNSGADFLGVLQSMAGALDNILNDTNVQKAFAQAFAGVSSLISGILGNLKPFKDVLIALGPPIQLIGQYLGDVFAKALPYIADIFTALSPAIGAVVTTMGPFTEVVDALGPGLVGLAAAAAPVLKTLAAFVSGAVANVAPILKTLADAAGPLLTQAFSALSPILVMAGAAIAVLAPRFNELVKASLPLVAVLIKIAGTLIRAIGPTVFAVVVGGMKLLISAIQTVVKWITPLLEKFSNANPVLQTVVVGALAAFVIFSKLGGVVGILTKVFIFGIKIWSKLAPMFAMLSKIFKIVRVAMLALTGPIGLIVLAVIAFIAILALLYQKNETFRKFINEVWAKIKEAIAVAITWFVEVAWPAMKIALSALGEAVMWLWEKAIKPAFKAIGDYLSWLWNSVWKPLFEAMGKLVIFLWNNWLKPTFELIWFGFKVVAGYLQFQWVNIIKPMLEAFGKAVGWVWTNWIKPSWENAAKGFKILGGVIKDWWDKTVKPKIDQFKTGIGLARDAVGTVVDAIKRKWETLSSVISGPLDKIKNFINTKFIDPINSLLKKLGVTTFTIPNIGGGGPQRSRSTKGGAFAGGGSVAGNSPNATADNIPAWLTAKEWVIKQKSSLKMNRKYPGWLDHINRHGEPPTTSKFASGGQVASSPTTSHIGAPKYGIGGQVLDFLKGPIDFGKNLMKKVIDSLGLDGFIRELGQASGKKLAGGLMEKIKSIFDVSMEGAGGNLQGGKGVGHALSRVRAMLIKGLSITSTYRTPARNAAVGGSPTSKHMDRANPAVDIGGPISLLDKFHGILKAAGGWRQLTWRAPGHYDHIHVAAAGGQVPSYKNGDNGDGSTVADIGTVLQPGKNVLNNKLGKPEPLVRADLLDARLKELAATIRHNTDILVRQSGAATLGAVGLHKGLSGSGGGSDVATVVQAVLAAQGAGNGTRLRIEGQLSFDEQGRAYIRGVAQEVVDSNDDFAGTTKRMRGK